MTFPSTTQVSLRLSLGRKVNLTQAKPPEVGGLRWTAGRQDSSFLDRAYIDFESFLKICLVGFPFSALSPHFSYKKGLRAYKER